MSTTAEPGTWGFHRAHLESLRRTDVGTADIPLRNGPAMRERPDVAFESIPGSSGFSIATEWVGRVCFVMGIVLFVLVMIAVPKGLAVQHSARDIVDNFHTANNYFDERTDLSAPARARAELETLRGVLADLNTAAGVDVGHLANLLPTTEQLLTAGRYDSRVAAALSTIAQSLNASAASLHSIAATAGSTVSAVDDQLAQAIGLVSQLNNELARTTRKLAPIPAQDGLIPPQSAGGH